MFQKKIVQILLSPISLLYGGIIALRNMFYETGLLKGSKFSIPVISVGNLSIGGAGKSPHIEYLIEMLKEYIDVAVLSRGYKRETSGFRIANIQDTALTIGDEPLQFSKKYKDIVVAVDENRALGIPMLIQHFPNLQTVLLDDAFQHRQVLPGINILLTAYNDLFTDDFLLPSGRLREWRSAYQRADIIVVSKCPDVVSEQKRNEIITKINPLKNQKVYFSKYTYSPPTNFFDAKYRINLDTELDVFLLSGIANTSYLKDYLQTQVKNIHPIEFEDHHNFTFQDIDYIVQKYTNHPATRKIVLTTEKDAMRLEIHKEILYKNQIPIFILPVKVSFEEDDKSNFEKNIKDYLLDFKY